MAMQRPLSVAVERGKEEETKTRRKRDVLFACNVVTREMSDFFWVLEGSSFFFQGLGLSGQ